LLLVLLLVLLLLLLLLEHLRDLLDWHLELELLLACSSLVASAVGSTGLQRGAIIRARCVDIDVAGGPIAVIV